MENMNENDKEEASHEWNMHSQLIIGFSSQWHREKWRMINEKWKMGNVKEDYIAIMYVKEGM